MTEDKHIAEIREDIVSILMAHGIDGPAVDNAADAVTEYIVLSITQISTIFGNVMKQFDGAGEALVEAMVEEEDTKGGLH